MVDPEQLKAYFPQAIAENTAFGKYIVKENIQLSILDFLSTSIYVRSLVFIGGTSLRLTKGINRFSEDLDFDCKDFSEADFMAMTDEVMLFLKRSGYQVENRAKPNPRLTAFRSNIHFPEFLFNLGLSAHKDERFLIKLEAQDQLIPYKPVLVDIKRMGYFFPFPVPPDPILCAMKIAALLGRAKGRDFFDVMFLLGQTPPDYGFLATTSGIHDKAELKSALLARFDSVDIHNKARDFAHLALSESDMNKVLRFREFIEQL